MMCDFCHQADGLLLKYQETHFIHAFCAFRHVNKGYLEVISYQPLNFGPIKDICPNTRLFYCTLCSSKEGIVERCSTKEGCPIYEHAYCTAKKSKYPIDLHSRFRCGFHSSRFVELEEHWSWHHAELVHSLVGNSTSLMRLSEMDLSIMHEIMALERDCEITEPLDLVNFYAWLERLSRSAGESTSIDAKVFDDVLLDKFLESFKIFPRSPYLS